MPVAARDAVANPEQHAKAERHHPETGREHGIGADQARRDRALGPLDRVDPGIEGIVQIHAGDVEQGQRHEQRQGPRIERVTARQHDAGQRVGPDGRQVGDAAEPERDLPAHARQLVQGPGELAGDRARDAGPRGSARAARPRCRSRPRDAARSALPAERQHPRGTSCVVGKSPSWSRKTGTWKCTRHSRAPGSHPGRRAHAAGRGSGVSRPPARATTWCR